MSAKLIKQLVAGAHDFQPFALPVTTVAALHTHGETPTSFEAKGTQMFHRAASDMYADLSEDEATNKAAHIIAEAEQHAAHIIAEANSNIAAIKSEFQTQALHEARQLAAQEMHAELAPAREQLAATLHQLDSLHEIFARHAERDLVQLALEMARKIVYREVSVDREIALTLARVALARLNARTLAHIHLHPDDYAHITQSSTFTNSNVELVSDEIITPGGCLIRTDMGDIDTRIEEQFATLEREFLPL